MARRILNHKMLDSADISTTQTQNGHTNVEGVDEATIMVEWSGTAPVGVISVQASNSEQDEFTKGTEVWYDLDFGASIDVTGATGDHQINFTAMPFKAIRFVYTATSGTGTMTAHINATSLGA